ncbi:MAG: hypothetical protein HY678_03330 [Chloroflexi bacterium]|nr:hypothetical protein [Chloroflexota bacterium]
MNPDLDLVPVMSMADPATFAMAQDLLKRHGIQSFLRGEPHTWAIRTPVPMPYHASMGPVLLVERHLAKAAAELLAGMPGTTPASKSRRRGVRPSRIQRLIWKSKKPG